MRHLMLFLGMGTALIAASACRDVPNGPLTAAAARNDVDTIRQLLADGHTADEGDEAMTALIWAARSGAIDALKLLLDAGATPDARDNRDSWTALQHATHKGQTAAVHMLLDYGADPNAAVHSEALTPLLMAAGDADPTIVKLLLAYGADPRGEGEWGDSPLARAVSGGALMDIDRPLLGGCRAETVRALLEYDPMLRLPDSFAGRSALLWARFHGCREVLTLVDSGRKS